jgi:multidrug resistance efflux pump
LWLTDLFVGPLLRLEADGLVVAEYVSIGVPFAAQVEEMRVVPGAEVAHGDVLARVSSVDLKVSIATLTARNAELSTKRADIQDRVRVAAAVLPIARDRAQEADRAIGRIRTVRDGGNVSLATWSQALSERFIANERVAELQAESYSAETSLAAVNAALADATRALAGLNDAYGSGIVTAPSDGIIGLSTARPGDVLTVGQPLMVLYKPQRYVLAYLETGTLYSVSAGDEVKITNGFVRTSGRVAEVLPVADQLPEEFRKVFQPRGRSQVARITLAEGKSLPLFAKVRLSGIGWLSPGSFVRTWLEGWLRPGASGGRSRPAADG